MSAKKPLEDFCNDLRNVAGMIEMGERISFRRDIELLREAADRLEFWKHVADTRLEQVDAERAAYRSLHNDTIGPL